jgi:hypothetical protein
LVLRRHLEFGDRKGRSFARVPSLVIRLLCTLARRRVSG